MRVGGVGCVRKQMQITLLDFLTSCWLHPFQLFPLYSIPPGPLGPQKSSLTIKDLYSTSPLLSWTSNQWPLAFWCLVSSCTLVLLSSNHPRMFFSVCPLVVWSSILQIWTEDPLIFRTDTNVDLCLLTLCIVCLYTVGSFGLLVLLSYCHLDFLTCLTSSCNLLISSPYPLNV